MAFDAFLKLGDIKGETGDSVHKDEIEVLSFHFGVSNQGSSGAGSGGGSGKCQVQDFSFVKKVDKSSPVLFQHCATGTHVKDAMFVVRKAGGTQLEYLKIKLVDILVSSVRPGGSSQGSEDIPMEEVSLNFTQIQIDYQPQGPDGKALGGPIHGGWDVKKSVKV
jgi:type VI secretion system secreted protein Hcp